MHTCDFGWYSCELSSNDSCFRQCQNAHHIPTSTALLLMAEIPFPTTWDGAKTPVHNGINYISLNWLAGFFHQLYELGSFGCMSNLQKHDCQVKGLDVLAFGISFANLNNHSWRYLNGTCIHCMFITRQ